MFYAYAARFDVTGNLNFFAKLFSNKTRPKSILFNNKVLQ